MLVFRCDRALEMPTSPVGYAAAAASHGGHGGPAAGGVLPPRHLARGPPTADSAADWLAAGVCNFVLVCGRRSCWCGITDDIPTPNRQTIAFATSSFCQTEHAANGIGGEI